MPVLFTEIGYFVFDYLGVSVAVADAIATVLEYVAIAELLNAAQKALNPAAKSGIGSGLESNYYNAEASIRIIYGNVRVGGMQTVPPITYGANGEYLVGVLTLAGHQVDSINDVQFDSNTILSASIGAITGAATDGLVSTGMYANLAWIRRYTGTLTQNVDWILHNVIDSVSFPSTFRGRGIAYVATQLKFAQNVYASIPTQMYSVKGALVYDPRLDSTQAGGSGSQRAATPSTWAWASNPALCLANYLMAVYGGEYTPAEIDWSTVINAANVCDFLLTGSYTTPDGDQKRYTCNGAMLASQGGGGQPFTDNIALLTNAMMGRVIYSNGIWSMFAGSWQTPNVVPINKNDWVSGLQIGFEQGRDKRFNESHCWYISPGQNWQRVECAVRYDPTFQTSDGEVIPFESDQPFCTVEKEAQRKAEVLLRQSRNQCTVSGKLPPRFQGIKLWDTVNVNYAEFGWSSKTFRVSGCTLNIDGSVDISLAEEYAADWTDMLTGDYNNPSTFGAPGSGRTVPSVPLNFSANVLNGSISFDWNAGDIIPFGTRYRILGAGFSLSIPDSKTVLWQGDALHATLVTGASSQTWYQVQAFANSDFSAYSPNTYGVGLVGSYSQPGFGPLAWNAYLSPSNINKVSANANNTGAVGAVVVNGTSPVFSWTNPSSIPNIGMFGATSANVLFATSGMTLGTTRGGTFYCNIIDGSNVTSISVPVHFSRDN